MPSATLMTMFVQHKSTVQCEDAFDPPWSLPKYWILRSGHYATFDIFPQLEQWNRALITVVAGQGYAGTQGGSLGCEAWDTTRAFTGEEYVSSRGYLQRLGQITKSVA